MAKSGRQSYFSATLARSPSLQIAASLMLGAAIGRFLTLRALSTHSQAGPNMMEARTQCNCPPNNTCIKVSSDSPITLSLHPEPSNIKKAQPPHSSDSDSAEAVYYKMVFVVRKDLGMGPGKVIAQCCHAAIDLHSLAIATHPDAVTQWLNRGATKVVLRVGSEEELMSLYEKVERLGITSTVIEDAGHTQVHCGSKTVLGLGPDY
ncbi:hypothetical protein SeMB42_g04490 [Synchytrium endobioticum]|uniref:peptidyl-tRNA hydrolase n=1 Tax=Synchytrium endobioticum TaxID=286115 RepID=A0A507CXM8_9FUNG|nr:hypothetical protein SeMB42_g04490 [Synchytrium endobioticum]